MEQASQSVRPFVTWRKPALPNRALRRKCSDPAQLGKEYEVLERVDEQADWCVTLVLTAIDGGLRDAPIRVMPLEKSGSPPAMGFSFASRWRAFSLACQRLLIPLLWPQRENEDSPLG
jgi:hypothetical protein